MIQFQQLQTKLIHQLQSLDLEQGPFPTQNLTYLINHLSLPLLKAQVTFHFNDGNSNEQSISIINKRYLTTKQYWSKFVLTTN